MTLMTFFKVMHGHRQRFLKMHFRRFAAVEDLVLICNFTWTWLRYVRILCCRISVCRLSVGRLSFVTFMRPTQRVKMFGNVSMPICTLAIRWPPCKILRRLSCGEQLRRELKTQEG